MAFYSVALFSFIPEDEAFLIVTDALCSSGILKSENKIDRFNAETFHFFNK